MSSSVINIKEDNKGYYQSNKQRQDLKNEAYGDDTPEEDISIIR